MATAEEIFRNNIHKSNQSDLIELIKLINELEKVSMDKRIRAKHHLSNILSNVKPMIR